MAFTAQLIATEGSRISAHTGSLLTSRLIGTGVMVNKP